MPRQRKTGNPPRQWLYDRVNGVTLEGEERPPHFLCFPPQALKCCPSLLEQNCCCICLGKVGCCAPNDDWARGIILKVGSVMNILGFLLLTFSAMALTERFQWLENAISFANAEVIPENEDDMESLSVHLGIRAAAFTNPNTFGEAVIPFDRFCAMTAAGGGGLDKYMDADACDTCHRASLVMLSAILVSLAAFVPTFCTDILRVYSNFDVNCQKVSSTLLSLVTLAGCGLAYFQFSHCLNSFFDGPVSYDSAGSIVKVDSPQAEHTVIFEWQLGLCTFCLFGAAFLKLIQFLCNCCIPTPSITRDLADQEEYEKLAEESDDEDASLLDEWH
eukprot:scaffold22560_cov135-Cylindrotheca_fusiformis.AAC.49